MTVKIWIEPVAAARPRFGNGFTYTPTKYRQFKNSAMILLKEKYKGPPLSGALEVCVVFSILRPKSVVREFPEVKPDLDNYIKAIFDAANNILWKDDSQIVDLHSFKIYGEPSILISVKHKGEE